MGIIIKLTIFFALFLLSFAKFNHALADSTSAEKLVKAALERTNHKVTYDGSYQKIDYPNGDVPPHIGVCSDVVIRAYRAAFGIDLQKRVHEDMRTNFSIYPQIWGLNAPDKNIDHRRVPNLRTFFKRHGQSLPVTDDPDNYKPGDIVTWNIAVSDGFNYRNYVSRKKNIPHIGIVADRYRGNIPMIVHNIGFGPKLENMLFNYQITGHYRYGPQ